MVAATLSLSARFALRVDPVIRLGSMTAHDAGSPGFLLGKSDGVRPCAKRNLVTDMLGLTAGVGIMTGNTVPPLLHIDMEIMEVVFTVPEVRQRTGKLLFRYFLVMTAEAKIVILRTVIFVKLFRIITDQHPRVLRTMHLVAGSAVTRLHRSVPVLAAFDMIAQLIMAFEAERLCAVLQKRLHVGRVRTMAIGATPLIHRGMLVGGGFDILIHSRAQLLVATRAEGAARLVKLKPRLRAVRIMTLIAILTHRLVNMFHGKFVLPILVALKTDLSLFR